MYAPSPFAPAHAARIANAYRHVGVETGVASASPHRLVALLFEGLQESLARAQGAMESGSIEIKADALGRAARIVEEGLKAGLDLQQGGQLATDLRDLYAYITLRLMHANLRNDVQAVQECKRLINPLHEAWTAIGPKVDGAR